ncbi:hypothetical protein GCM10007073_13210 [Micrococcus flavus]|nr:hypothetical protein GCM10007073_13210 [Micrococcus flavus]
MCALSGTGAGGEEGAAGPRAPTRGTEAGVVRGAGGRIVGGDAVRRSRGHAPILGSPRTGRDRDALGRVDVTRRKLVGIHPRARAPHEEPPRVPDGHASARPGP